MKAKEILNLKGRNVIVVAEDATVTTAVSELVNNKVGLLLVKNIAGEIVGVVSERDIIKKCLYLKKDPDQVIIKDIMTTKEKIVAASEEDDIQILMNIMTSKRIRHIPIFRGTELTGIISIGDIVKNLLEQKDYEIKTLVDYITGKYPV
ncbi:MAG: CBS domain protein [Ignavibacteriae bacterium]|nr:MAG: CBS domain protein [Ignavibacteriota bacterium]